MPREFSRGSRVADLIQREIAIMVQRELKDPRIGMLTINDVKVSRDLSYADVYFTVLPEDRAEQSQEVLDGAAGFLRSHLSRILNTRVVPTLRFHYDPTLVEGQRMDQVISEARARDRNSSDGNRD
ncbi:MAG: 30S ribosome-binding factor RbfA [Proteobacteria bacterium]|jgi:ribosome-binding factor A|nr:30S ribosome-binding factor RbfA [Pseudomonadota bacterium]MDA1300316.1 30S ribosome-binding factor RbfA [Pseudomonadota bacterium]